MKRREATTTEMKIGNNMATMMSCRRSALNKNKTYFCLIILIVIATFSSSVLMVGAADDTATTSNDDAVFRWASTGGGWRAMFACIGYANVFQQAGLFTEDSSLFSAIVSILHVLSVLCTVPKKCFCGWKKYY